MNPTTLVPLEGIPNFRKLAPTSQLFRSAAMEKATPNDLEKLSEELGIRTVVDLRGDSERKSLSSCPLGDNFEVIRGDSVEFEISSSIPSSTRRCFHISLLEAERQYKGMYKRMNPPKKAAAVWWSLFSGRKETELYLQEINNGGLETLYQVILETSKAEICQVLRIIADPTNHPLVFHCVKGKDRTGLVAMLVSHCLNTSKQDIISDYSVSWGLLEKHEAKHNDKSGERSQSRASKEKEDKYPGIDWSKFKGTPPSVMESTISFIQSTYGSVDSYLDAIGFGSEWQKKLHDACR